MAGLDWGLGVIGLLLVGCATSADPAPSSGNAGSSGSGAAGGSDFGGQGGDAQGGGDQGGSTQGGSAQGGSGAEGGSGAHGGTGADDGMGSDGGTGAQGGSAGSGATAGSSGSASGGSAGQLTCPSLASAGAETVLDDVEDGDDAILSADGRIGYWFSYKDDADSGSSVSLPAAMAPGANATTHAIQVTGKSSSTAEYGPGFGFPLLSLDNGGSNTSSSCPYDLSSYSGISLWLKATGVTSLEVLVPTSATTSTAEGGTCATNCDDHFAKSVSVSTGWAKVDVPFSSLAQGGWGTPASFDAHGAIGVGFGVAPGVTFEVWVDELTLTP